MPRRSGGGYESFESDTDAENEGNKNVGWIKSRGLGVFYVLAICVVYLVVFLAIPEQPALVASIVNGAHAIISFFALHYQRGSVVWTDSGEFDDLTFWQQLDGGFAWTANKKLLMLFPLILMAVVQYILYAHLKDDVDEYKKYAMVNLGFCALAMVPKLFDPLADRKLE